MTLHIVPPIPKPEEGPNNLRKKVKMPPDMLLCQRCGGREVTETIIGGFLQGGKLKGGTRQLICVGCLLKGERVVLA